MTVLRKPDLILLCLLLAASALSLWLRPVFAQQSPPPPPMTLAGNVTINGFPASDGTEVRAEINGVPYTTNVSVNRTISGTYGVHAIFQVPTDRPETTIKEGGVNGEIVVLKVSGVEAGSTLFRSGGSEQVNLVVISDVVPPDAPENLTKTSPDNDATPSFSWSPVDGAVKYEVRIDGGGPIEVTSTTFTVPSELQDGQHEIVVRGVNVQGNQEIKGQNALLNFIVDTTAPSSPTNLTRTGVDNPPSFSWTAATDLVSQINHYEVSFDLENRTNIGNVTNYTSPDFLSLGPHLFLVRAVDTAGNVGLDAQLQFDITTALPRPTGTPTPTPIPAPTPTPEPTPFIPTPTPTAIPTPEITSTPTTDLTPTPAVTVTPGTTPTPVLTPTLVVPTPPPTPVLTRTVRIDASAKISPEALGMDDKGNAVQARDEPVKVTSLQGDVSLLTLPVSVAEGNSLIAFEDTASGITVKKENGKTKVSIPIKDVQGLTLMKITATVGELKGTGASAQAVAESIELSIEEETADLSTVDTSVGQVSTSFSSQLKRIPDDASVTVSISKEPPSDAQNAFALAAQNEGTAVKEVAFSVSVQKSNLQDRTDVGESFITMKVSKAWIDKVGGVENVKIFRLADDGSSEALQTTFQGFDAQSKGVFRGFSPKGLSVFALVALEEPPKNLVQVVVEGFGSVRLTSPGGDIVVLLPENPRNSPIRLQLTPVSIAVSPAPAPSGFGIVGKVFILDALNPDFSPAEDLIFDIPVQLILFYTQEELDAAKAEESQLAVAQFRPGEGGWQLLHTTRDPNQKRVIASVEKLSYFALMARGATTPSVALPGTGDAAIGIEVLLGSIGTGLAAMSLGLLLLRKSRMRSANRSQG